MSNVKEIGRAMAMDALRSRRMEVVSYQERALYERSKRPAMTVSKRPPMRQKHSDWLPVS